MKIICGQFKGKNFFMPALIRPSANVTRKAVFDIIGHNLSGLAFLDLFAGSGAVGLEGLSLGAREVTFVDNAPACVETINENLILLGPQSHEGDRGKARVELIDVFVFIKRASGDKQKYDIVFMDPPYNEGLGKKALKTLVAYDILQPNCYIIVEHGKRELLPAQAGRFSVIKQRKYGKSFVTIYQGD